MLGYTLDDLDKMTACINIAHDIIDGPAEVEAGLQMASDRKSTRLNSSHT